MCLVHGTGYRIHRPQRYNPPYYKLYSFSKENSYYNYKLHQLQLSFYESLWEHMIFTVSCISLIILFFMGVHKKIVASSVYVILI